MENQGLPTLDEIRQLPLFAQVAFAARCARRVESVAIHSDLAFSHKQAVSKAIAMAESMAEVGTKGWDLDQAAESAADTHDAAHVAADPDVSAAVHAAAAAARALVHVFADSDADVRGAVVDAAVAANKSSPGITQAIRSDFESLQQTARKGEHWTGLARFPSSIFSSLKGAMSVAVFLNQLTSELIAV